MKRQVLIKTTERSGIINHITEATTLGELRLELDINLNPEDMKVLIRSTRTSLDFNDSVLPLDDFTLFVNPKKTKAGQNWDDLGFHELRAECKKVGLPATGVSSSNMRKSLEEYYENNNEDNSLVSFLLEAKTSLEKAIEVAQTQTVQTVVGVDPELLEEIERDFQQLRTKLN